MHPRTYQAFFDELQKIALSEKDVPEGTEITTSTDELISKMRPGDIIATKFTKPSLLDSPESKVIEWLQQIRNVPRDLSSWTHTGIYAGDGKIRHMTRPFEGKDGYGPASKSTIRDQSIKRLESIGKEFLIMRPQVTNADKQKALHRLKDLKGVTYNTINALRAGFWTMEKDKAPHKEKPKTTICTEAVTYAYPMLNFGHTKSVKTLLPSDILVHRKLTPVIAYSDEE